MIEPERYAWDSDERLLAELFREAVREHRFIHSQFVDTCDVCCLLDMVAERLK